MSVSDPVAFRGFTAAASLKHMHQHTASGGNESFPRFHRRGLIEAIIRATLILAYEALSAVSPPRPH